MTAGTVQETEAEPVKEVQNSDVWDYPEYVAILPERAGAVDDPASW